MAREQNNDELLAAFDADGRPLGAPVARAEAHRRGIWHRTVSVFVLNYHGELLIERRSDFKDLFPGFFDIVGGHLGPGQKPIEGAKQELEEELSLLVQSDRLVRLSQEDGVIERVVLPDRGIINLERKTIYLLTLSREEEYAVAKLAAKLQRSTPEELEERGTSGEVSEIEFWSWERLFSAARSTGQQVLASGTLSALHTDHIREAVAKTCLALRDARRKAFITKYTFLPKASDDDRAFDRMLFDLFLEQAKVLASLEEAKAVFSRGAEQVAGAYEIGSFRQLVAGDDHWEQKLRDPETRYVVNLLNGIGFGRASLVQRKLRQRAKEIQTFVAELLNFPLFDGTRFRDRLGNLADIAVARKAVLFWLQKGSEHLIPARTVNSPTSAITQECLRAGRALLETTYPSARQDTLVRVRQLLLINLAAASADFNNPAFQGYLRSEFRNAEGIQRFLEQNVSRQLCLELGGDHFLSEFCEQYLYSGKPVNIAYLAGNAAQAHATLALAQEFLRLNSKATVHLITKSGAPGSDLTLGDARAALRTGAAKLFRDLVRFKRQRRFVWVADGPKCHGLDPARLSRLVTRVLADASVILAEGQAYAEIRGWKKPTYIAFRVNGRVAESIHGISRRRGENGFVRLTPGVDHFQGFESSIRRTIIDGQDNREIPVAAQTTAEYVQALLSENLHLVARHLFEGNHLEACRHVEIEADRLGRTFAQVVIGAASKCPAPSEVARHFRRMHFPVFACGGGGGFSSVTLRALRMLGLPTVAGVPSTDDGGSTGDLQRWLRRLRGFVFGVGDMAAILEGAISNRGKQALLAYRFDCEPKSLVNAVMQRIVEETAEPTYADSIIQSAEDFLSFVCGQLELARIIDRAFRSAENSDAIPLKGASIRNLNVIAAYELCQMLGDRAQLSDESRLAAAYVLQKTLGLATDLLVLPVTYSQTALYVDYGTAVPPELAKKYEVPEDALADHGRRLYGQQYIDKLLHYAPRLAVGLAKGPRDAERPSANPEYLKRMKDAELFVMGAGSLIGSQLSQLVVPGVVDILIDRQGMRKILVLNHVKLDETLGMSLREQIELIEAVAAQSASPALLKGLGRKDNRLRISDLFTDIVVPRTVARELELEMPKTGNSTQSWMDSDLRYADLPKSGAAQTVRVFCNRYVDFLLTHPDVTDRLGITPREIEVLSYLEQPPHLYQRRSEAGRYRGAMFATESDLKYLTSQGIQVRSIHEVDSIGENWKFVKAEGTPSLEFFPGLMPEALLGIFRIALERTRSASSVIGNQGQIRPPA